MSFCDTKLETCFSFLSHTVEIARTAIIAAAGVPALLERAPLPIDQTPPEVGLTQHHLPEDRKPDGRLILHLAPDSERAAQFFRSLVRLRRGRPPVDAEAEPVPGDADGEDHASWMDRMRRRHH